MIGPRCLRFDDGARSWREQMAAAPEGTGRATERLGHNETVCKHYKNVARRKSAHTGSAPMFHARRGPTASAPREITMIGNKTLVTLSLAAALGVLGVA